MTGQFPGGEPGMLGAHAISIVLVVEDEVLVRMHGTNILEEAGFDVVEASDADEALAILERQHNVHLLFTDIDMPGSMDGLELACIVHERWPDIHLLLTSGHHHLTDVQVPGEGTFLHKPWTSASLIDRIINLLAV
jgi:two-component system, response regulator PdtaR